MAKEKLRMAREGGAIRLTLSARVANDLGALQKGLGSLAERLGHTQCATGCDILEIMLEREFVLSDAVALNPQPLPPRGPLPDPWLNEQGSTARRIGVTIPDKVNNNIDALKRAIGVVVDKLGCGTCCSGFDIFFRREIATMTLDENLEVVHFGGVG